MENRLLKYFLVVAQEENITRASEILHVSQPALSKQLMQLEDELGAKLFIRGKRSVTLTEEGRFLRGRAQEIIDLTEKTERDFQDGIVKFNGVVSIGMGESTASEWIANSISEFTKIYPEVRFDLYSANGDNVKERIEKGLLDIGIIVGLAGDLSKYNYIPLPVKDRWGVLVSPDHPLARKQFVTPDNLEGEKIFLSKRSMPQSNLTEWFGSKYNEKNVLITYNLIKNAAMFVQNGTGIALAIDGAVSLYDQSKTVWIPLAPEIALSNTVVWKKYGERSPSAARFIEFLNHSVGL
ncbi:MAG: LysR family transcriptional regulator [Candidatus Coproplasma sp.]